MVSDSKTNIGIHENIESLISTLSNKNGMIRQQARLALVKSGATSVEYLINALENPNKRVQWEAAKALITIGDIRSAPAFVQKLKDKSFELRWLAAEGLIALKENSLRPLLSALIDNPDDWDLRQGVHHVLHALEREGLLNDKCLCLLNELRSMEPELSIPIATETALASIPKEN